MTYKLLQITFRNPQGQTEAAQKAAWERAHQIAALPGLVWKIWIYSQEAQLAGGVYLFTDADSAQAYLNSSIVAALSAAPGVEGMTTTLFDVDEARTLVTRGPLTPQSNP
ncbi:MAG TPA: YdhR family protein [Leptolyngbyaceae cyanobacterium]